MLCTKKERLRNRERNVDYERRVELNLHDSLLTFIEWTLKFKQHLSYCIRACLPAYSESEDMSKSFKQQNQYAQFAPSSQ